MLKRSIAYSLVLAGVMCVLIAVSAAAQAPLASFDFEDGTLQGWKVISGDAGKLPTGPDTARHDQRFNQHGRYFIGLYENPNYDTATVVLQSPPFRVQADTISLLVGGGYQPDSCYVALYRVADDKEIYRETGRNSETMQWRYWDVRKLHRQRVYLKIVDSGTGEWGHINVDDIHEMSPAEETARQADAVAKQARYEKWLKTVNESSGKIVYAGKALQDIAMPIGGIGSGHVSLCGDGVVRQWCIFNKINEACVVPDSFFAIWAKPANGKPVAKLLQQTPIADLPAVGKVEFEGEYPIAEIHYDDETLPVQLTLRAFSPHIPMNDKDSAIPAAIFEFTLENKSSVAVETSVLSTLQNAVGYDGVSRIDDIWNGAYGGNENTPISTDNLRGVLLSNPSLKPDDKQFGTMCMASTAKDALVTAQWDDLHELWQAFSGSGDITGIKHPGPSMTTHTWNSAITVPATLQPGQRVTIPIVWTWHFPNLVVFWGDPNNQPRLGRMYANWFNDASDVAEYVTANYSRLAGDTERFRRTFYKTTLPYWMLDRISAQSSTLASTVCMWLGDGSFVAFEGAGCCPMNCTHVFDYEQQLAHLFPTLERNMRRIDLEVQQKPDGGIRHRTTLPLTEPRGTEPFVDGHLGTILKSYREYRLSSNRKWLDSEWPHIKLAMQFVLNSWDPNKDGVLVNEQWNTYDAAMYGPNTFIGTLYLAALRASEEMAKIEGDNDFASTVRAVFDSGRKRLDEACWNGEYYQQIEAKPSPSQVGTNQWLLEDWPAINDQPNVNRPYGKGCHSDQLLGQWWADILDLGYLLPEDHVRSSLSAIMKHNWVKDFGDVLQQPRTFAGENDPGLYCCTWPNGNKPRNEMLYSFEVWTGIEYEVAGLMLFENRTSDAYKIVKAVSDRYNGVPRPPIQRNPWAEVECSNHYARAMSAWAMLLAAQGYKYCGPDGALEFNPIVSPNNHSSFFTTAEGWGLFSQKREGGRQANVLALEYGKLELRKLTLHLPPAAKNAAAKGEMTITVNKTPGSFTRVLEGTTARIEFPQPITITAGEQLRVTMEWEKPMQL